MSTGIRSPFKFTRHSKGPIISTQFLVLALAMRDANMTAEISHKCTFCHDCFELPLHAAINHELVAYPFDFHSDKVALSFVTCSGQGEQMHLLGILFYTFDSMLWIYFFSCVFLFLAYISLRSGHYNFSENFKNCISLVLGALGCEISITGSLKLKKQFACYLLFWSFIGILIGNLYQARLTETLIVPVKYNANLTLEEIVNKNFTVLLIADSDKKVLSSDDKDKEFYQYCMNLRVCRLLVFELAMDVKRNMDFVLKNFQCSLTPWIYRCKQLFAQKPYIRKLPKLVSNAKNYSFLVTKLSSCSENVVFIHNRQEINKVMKPKLPRVVNNYRREFKCLPLPDDLLSTPVITCSQYAANLIQPIVKKYINHGLYNSWANLASMLSFRWNTGMKPESAVGQIIILDEKFVSIVFIVMIAHAVSLIFLAGEFLHHRSNSWVTVSKLTKPFTRLNWLGR